MVSNSLSIMFVLLMALCRAVHARKELSKMTEGCLPRFLKRRLEYARCISEHCFLFKEQSYFVNVPPTMKSEDDQALFPCNRHHLVHRKLSGVAFDILKRTSSLDALCAWVGRNCSYNQMVFFMAEQAHAGYKFSTLTAMVETCKRRKVSWSSVPFCEGRIAIVGLARESESPSSLQQLLGPFRASAWAAILAMLAAFCTLAVANEHRHHRVFPFFKKLLFVLKGKLSQEDLRDSLQSIACCICRKNEKERLQEAYLLPNADSSDLEDTSDEEIHYVDHERYDLNRRMLCISFTLFLAVSVIFYEAGIVNFLFHQTTAKLSKNLENVSPAQLRDFCLEKDQAVEDIFRDLVDPHKRFGDANFPWHRSRVITGCWAQMLNPKSKVKYVVTFTGDAEYYAKKYGVWSKVVAYEPDVDLISASRGFLHNFAVPRETAIKLDLHLLELRQASLFKSLLKQHAGESLRTRIESRDLDFGVIVMALSFLLIPLFVVVTFLLCSLRKY